MNKILKGSFYGICVISILIISVGFLSETNVAKKIKIKYKVKQIHKILESDYYKKILEKITIEEADKANYLLDYLCKCDDADMYLAYVDEYIEFIKTLKKKYVK